MNVVATAPIPGSRTPSFPLGAAIFVGFSMNSLNFLLVDLRWTQQRRAETVTRTIHHAGCDTDMQTKTDTKQTRGFRKMAKFRRN
jgi:hypothetical protein